MSTKNRGKWTVSSIFQFEWEASAKLWSAIPTFLGDVWS